jgi:hypothetical protein
MKKILAGILILFFVSTSFAQTSNMSGTRKNIATIMFASLGGAIIGLSTLSFYGEPQDHIGNIWLGLGLGALAGGGYVLNQSYTTQAQITNPHRAKSKNISLFQYKIEF